MIKNETLNESMNISLLEFQNRFDNFVEDFEEKNKASAIFCIIIIFYHYI